MLEYLTVGQIINIHGFRGEVKVYPLTDNINRFRKLKEVYVEDGEQLLLHQVEGVKFLSNTVVMKLKGIDTEEAANKLRNRYIKVDRKAAVKLPKDSFFICDLIGAEVFDEKGALLGKIKDVLQTGSNDVFVVQGEEKDILIPALKDIFRDINIEDKKIIVELPEGLI
ncbi:MAG: ribosome maturation factor RimM [Caulobacteraceae bacterium]